MSPFCLITFPKALIEILNEAQRLIIGLVSPDHAKVGSILFGDSQWVNASPNVRLLTAFLLAMTDKRCRDSNISNAELMP